jgi:hypothetical protein
MSTEAFPNSAHYNVAMKGLGALSDAAQAISKAKAIGIDTAQYEEGHAYLSDFLHRFVGTFFPDRVVPPTGSGVHESNG